DYYCEAWDNSLSRPVF
nr:immunoglobulin light chain junction region [Macaca mulatta]MOV95512.1 immunoglobulin light chain junction region [Macaca mulatta]MOV95945.1 immunoglobulin light chain junction region [Macaca mulatta]MOV96169.1 immunoglobulin light chain junction region [Macaca mulatta]MOV98380.1 immunoglobulin light chain junction region [Macaca mulatta]